MNSRNSTSHRSTKKKTSVKKALQSILIKDLSNLYYLQNSFQDFSIFVRDKNQNKYEFKVHKCVLSARSGFFSLFFKKGISTEIDLPDVDKETMEWILKYIYLGEIFSTQKKDLSSLLKISIQFQLDLVSNFLEQLIFDSLNIMNVCDILVQNEVFKSSKIEQGCLSFIDSNFSEIKKNDSYLNLKEEQIYNLIQFKIQKREILDIAYLDMINQWIKNYMKKIKKDHKKQKFQLEKTTRRFFSEIHLEFIDRELVSNLPNFSYLSNYFSRIKQVSLYQEKMEMENIHNKETKSLEKKIQRKDNELEEVKKELKDLQQNSNLKEKQKYQEIKQLKEKIESQKILEEVFKTSTIITDIEQVQKFREWINKDDFLKNIKLRFSKNKDQTSENFHKKCDDKGSTLVLIKTKEGYIFGGFTEVGWQSAKNGDDIQDPKAFLFSLKNPKGISLEKFPVQKRKAKEALGYMNLEYGPDFNDIIVDSDKLESGQSSSFGYRYHLPQNIIKKSEEAINYFAGGNGGFSIQEIECWF